MGGFCNGCTQDGYLEKQKELNKDSRVDIHMCEQMLGKPPVLEKYKHKINEK